MLYTRNGVWYVGMKHPVTQRWVRRTLKTPSRHVAQRYQFMLDWLERQGATDLLDALREGQLEFAAAEAQGLDVNAMRQLLRSQLMVDLDPLVTQWAHAMRATGALGPETLKHYVPFVRSLIVAGQRFPADRFTAPAVMQHIQQLSIRSSSMRAYVTAFASFGNYLQAHGVMPNPMRGVRRPKPLPPRTMHLTTEQAQQLVAAAPTRNLQLAFALAYGAGAEASAIVSTRLDDFIPATHEVRVRGTKNANRDRLVRVADWAWHVLALRLMDLSATSLYEEPLGAVRTRHLLTEAHRKLVTSLGLPPVTLHDARHYFAVRLMRAGTPAEVVARQLGHRDATMVLRVYGRFAPSAHDRNRWEQMAQMLEGV